MTISYGQRLAILAFLGACGFLLLLGRLVTLQVLEHDRWREGALAPTERRIRGRRGLVVDASGRRLAEEAAAFHLEVVFRRYDRPLYGCPDCGGSVSCTVGEVPDRCPVCRRRTTLRRLPPPRHEAVARFVGMRPADLRSRIERKRRHVLARIERELGSLPPDRREAERGALEWDYLRRAWPILLDLPYEAAREVLLHPRRYPGFRVRAARSRHYPLGRLFVHVVGMLGHREETVETEEGERTRTVHGGVRGVEFWFDDALRGVGGRVRLVRDPRRAGGRRVLDEEPPEPGATIQLTIDARDQETAREVMAGAEGALVVVDARTGALLASVSLPDYRPEEHADLVLAAGERRARGSPLHDRTCRVFPVPGSVMKPFVALAALESGIDPDEMQECDGYFYVRGRRLQRLRCHAAHGAVDLRDALVRSCNIYFQNLMLVRGFFGRFVATGRRFGFGGPTGLEIESRRHHGLFREDPSAWERNVRVLAATGQGHVQVSAAQMARAYAGILTGSLPRLHVVARIGDRVVRPERTPLRIASEHLERVRDALARVPKPGGTAVGFGLEQWGIHCKTGTAERGDGTNNAWMAGFAPARGGRPDIAFAIYVARTTAHGGDACGPRLQRFFRRFYGSEDGGE